MKKSTLNALISYLDGAELTNLDEIRAELMKEANRGIEKAAANRALYDEAREVVLATMTTTPVTIAELFEQIREALPAGFSRGKLQYGMRVWSENGYIKKVDGSPASYQIA